MEYCEHPNAADIIAAGFTGYQGQDPEKASVIILGLDANWPCCLGPKLPNLWAEVKIYLSDSLAYWKNGKGTPFNRSFITPIHHPLISIAKNKDGMLLDEAGGKYHRIFNQYFGFSRCYADCITFIELLKMPTYGSAMSNKPKYRSMLISTYNASHLAFVDTLISNSPPAGFKLILMSDAVYRSLQFYKRNGGLSPRIPPLRLWTTYALSPTESIAFYIQNPRTLWVKHYHFSTYGKYQFTRLSAVKLKILIDQFCLDCAIDGRNKFPDSALTIDFINNLLTGEIDSTKQ